MAVLVSLIRWPNPLSKILGTYIDTRRCRVVVSTNVDAKVLPTSRSRF